METDHTVAQASGLRVPVSRKPEACATILALTLALAQPCAWATGGFDEEPLQTLADYLRLDQLPAKTFPQVLAETAADEPDAGPVKTDFRVGFRAELLALPKKPGAEALASLDKMIAAARAAFFQTALLNLLHDLREVFAGPANAAESAAYLEWRIEQADRFGVSFEAYKPGEAVPERPKPNAAFNAEIERQVAKASPALKPHWLYLRGAADWIAGRVPESQERFLKVVADYPKHPRAETALLMALRGALWKTRKPEYTQNDRQLDEGERVKAKKLFDGYFAKYPRGRFYGDALGWLGALAWDGGDYATALRCYTQQLDLPDHPELFPAALDMVEKTLARLAADPRDQALAAVAKHPHAAQALTYLVLNTSESDNYNGEIDAVDTVRGWRKKILPRLAAAISEEQKLYAGAAWKPRYLAMLASAASGAGQHEQALKLIGSAGAAVEKSDDLLLARGVALHRSNRPAEAATALQTLLAKFPQSPLAKGARLRLGLALTDDHRAGEAVLALDKLLPIPPVEKKPDAKDEADANEEDDARDFASDGEYPVLSGIDVNQVRALIDTLLNFAPIEELAATALAPGLDPVVRLSFTEPIAQRLLAREQFDAAKKYMTPAQWELRVGPLARLTKAAQEAKDPAARAAACRKLGDAWAAARGKLLTAPLDTDETRRKVFLDFAAEANGRRVASAPFIGAAGNFQLDLENRDELRHAFKWWLEASDAQPGTPATAQALWLALRAMPRIADVSPFTFQRAVARNWSDTARKLHDRLRTECADSVEARRYAVAWDFTAPKKRAVNDDEATEEISRRHPAGEDLPGMEALRVEDKNGGDGAAEPILTAEIGALEKDAGTADVEKLKVRTGALRAKARQTFVAWNDLRWVNLLDDLALFFAEADPGAEVRERYVKLRFRFLRESAIGGGSFGDDENAPKADEELAAAIKRALADPAVKPVTDYFEFLNLAIVANHFIFVKLDSKDKGGKDEADTYRTHDYPRLAKLAAAFLDKHPQSKKREAAMLLHARAVFQSSKEVVMKKYVTWPQGARWEGGYELSSTSQEPFDAKRVLAALDAYDRAFPHGRYAADIRDCRAEVALRMRDWKTALDLTVAQFDDKDAGALFTSAANRLGEIFAQLADERYRADVLAAIRAGKRGRELLAQYLADEADAHPLRYMKAWLRGELAAK